MIVILNKIDQIEEVKREKEIAKVCMVWISTSGINTFKLRCDCSYSLSMYMISQEGQLLSIKVQTLKCLIS